MGDEKRRGETRRRKRRRRDLADEREVLSTDRELSLRQHLGERQLFSEQGSTAFVKIGAGSGKGASGITSDENAGLLEEFPAGGHAASAQTIRVGSLVGA